MPLDGHARDFVSAIAGVASAIGAQWLAVRVGFKTKKLESDTARAGADASIEIKRLDVDASREADTEGKLWARIASLENQLVEEKERHRVELSAVEKERDEHRTQRWHEYEERIRDKAAYRAEIERLMAEVTARAQEVVVLKDALDQLRRQLRATLDRTQPGEE